MIVIRGLVVCLGAVTLCTAVFLFGDDAPSGKANPEELFSYKFSKHVIGQSGRITISLEVKPNRRDLVVSAVCSVRNEKQGIGQFPLGNVNANVVDAPVRFRIMCLDDSFIDKSTIRLEILDAKTNKQVGGIDALSLRDAVPEADWVVATPHEVRTSKNISETADIRADHSVQLSLPSDLGSSASAYFRFDKPSKVHKVRVELLPDTRFKDRRLGRLPDRSTMLFEVELRTVDSDGKERRMEWDSCTAPGLESWGHCTSIELRLSE